MNKTIVGIAVIAALVSSCGLGVHPEQAESAVAAQSEQDLELGALDIASLSDASVRNRECARILPLPPSFSPLRIGTEGAFPPFNYVDNLGMLSGWEMDYAVALCLTLGARCKYSTHAWGGVTDTSGIFHDLLRSKSFDVLVASVSPTDERKQHMLFSKPYFRTDRRWIVKGTTTHVDPSTNLSGKKIAVQSGTLFVEFVQTRYPLAQLIQTPTAGDALAMVTAGTAHATITLAPNVFQEIKAGTLKVVGGPVLPEVGTGAAMGFRPDERRRLVNGVNCAIEQLEKRGIHQAINAKYGVPGIVVP